MAALESTQSVHAENQFIQLQLIAQLRREAPQKITGEKTTARIAKIDEILKIRGATTLKELKRILKISPREMSQRVAKLDKMNERRWTEPQIVDR
jgi:hypothetical protein